MSLDQFSTVVVPLGILTTDETCELYKYFTCPVKPETRFNAVFRSANVSTLVTLSSNYKLKTVSPGTQVLQCYGNVNKPIRLHELRFIAHEVTAGRKTVVEINAVKLEQDVRATELSFVSKRSSKKKHTKSFVQEEFGTKPEVAVPFEKFTSVKPKKGHHHTEIMATPSQKLWPSAFSAVDINEEVRRPEYSEEPVLKTKRVDVKYDRWTSSTLTTPGDEKVYKVVHARWDGEDLLLDEGDFTLSYGFSITTTADDDANADLDDAVTADSHLADTKAHLFGRPTVPVPIFTSAPTNQLLCIRRLDHKLFESNDVAFTMNFPSGPLVAFAFYRL